MAKYTPPKSVSKNRKDDEVIEEEQEEAPEEEQEEARPRGRPKTIFKPQGEQPDMQLELLKYLIKNGFVNDIQVTMSFDQLLNTIEKMSG